MCKRNIDTEDRSKTRKGCKIVLRCRTRRMSRCALRIPPDKGMRQPFGHARRVRDTFTKLFAEARDINDLEAPESKGHNHRSGSICLAMCILITVLLHHVHQHKFIQRSRAQRAMRTACSLRDWHVKRNRTIRVIGRLLISVLHGGRHVVDVAAISSYAASKGADSAGMPRHGRWRQDRYWRERLRGGLLSRHVPASLRA